MAPLPKLSRSASCRGRDTTSLNTYIENPVLAKKMFANALDTSNILKDFTGTVALNECIFSYPDSEWYSVFLLDENGNKFFNYRGKTEAQLYFKLALAPSGRTASIIEETTDRPAELNDKFNCVINPESGGCVLYKPPKEVKEKVAKEPKEPKEPRVQRAKVSKAGPSEEISSEPLSEDISARLAVINLSEKATKTKQKKSVSRDFIESMESKTAIVEWMINNMNKEDILECIRKGSLSPEDISKAEAVSVVPEEIVQITEQLPQKEVKSILKKITKNDIVSQLNQEYTDKNKKVEAVVNLCRGTGKNYTTLDTPRGPRIVDNKGRRIDLDDALDECAGFEAERIRQRILSRRVSVFKRNAARSKMLAEAGSSSYYEEPEEPEESEEPSVPQLTAESIISDINEITDKVAKKNAIIALCIECGWGTKPTSRGPQIIDETGEQYDAEDALEVCAQIKAARMAGFGRRRRRTTRKRPQTVFKKAAKKCKGKPNYIKCMKRTLKKMYSFGKKKINPKAKKYTSAAGRKSPGISATSKPIGTVMKGLDGNMWVIKKSKTGVKRWVKK
jgi:hypothetical protein